MPTELIFIPKKTSNSTVPANASKISVEAELIYYKIMILVALV